MRSRRATRAYPQPVRHRLTDWDGQLPYRPAAPCLLYHIVDLDAAPPPPPPRSQRQPPAAHYFPAVRVCVPDHEGRYWDLVAHREYYAERLAPVELAERLPVLPSVEERRDAGVQADAWCDAVFVAGGGGGGGGGGARRRRRGDDDGEDAMTTARELVAVVAAADPGVAVAQLKAAAAARHAAASGAAGGSRRGGDRADGGDDGRGASDSQLTDSALLFPLLSQQHRFGGAVAGGGAGGGLAGAGAHSGTASTRDADVLRAVHDALRFLPPQLRESLHAGLAQVDGRLKVTQSRA